MNTDPTLLGAFVEVARTSSFGRAAEALHLDPSSVSRQIAQLERRLGVRLFERTTRQVWLTDAGAALLPDAEAVMDALDSFARSASAVDRANRGEVVVGFQAHAINSEVLGWISDAAEGDDDHDSVAVRLHEGSFADPSTGLRDRSTDLSIVFLPFDDTGIESAPLFDLPWLMFLPTGHPMADRPAVALDSLFDEPWIPPATDDQVFRHYWQAMDLRGDRPLPGAPDCATPEAGLAPVPVSDDRRTTVALAWRSGPLARPVARLRDLLLDRARHAPKPFPPA